MEPISTSFALTVFAHAMIIGCGFIAGIVAVESVSDCHRRHPPQGEYIPKKIIVRNMKPFSKRIRTHSE